MFSLGCLLAGVESWVADGCWLVLGVGWPVFSLGCLVAGVESGAFGGRCLVLGSQ